MGWDGAGAGGGEDSAPADAGAKTVAPAGRLGGKGTQKRRRQLRALMERDAVADAPQAIPGPEGSDEEGGGDLAIGDLDVSDVSVAPPAPRRSSRRLSTRAAAAAAASEPDTPGLLRAPVDREAMDGYVERLRKGGPSGWTLEDSRGPETPRGKGAAARRKRPRQEESAERHAQAGQARGPRRRVRAFLSPGGTAHVRVVDSDGEEAEDDGDEFDEEAGEDGDE